MNIFFDHQTFSILRYGGIPRYYCELVLALRKLAPNSSFDIGILISNNHHIEETKVHKVFSLLKNYNFKGKGIVNRFIYQINSLYTKQRISHYDILHATYYDTYFEKNIRKKNIPLVITVHDLINERLSYMFPELDHNLTISNKRKIMQSADVIIAISENTKRDIIEFYNISEEKIRVIYHGYTVFNLAKTDKYELKFPETYLLFVGQRIIYKNFKKFVESALPILKADPDLFIVCAGGGDFTLEEKIFFSAEGISNQMKYFPIDNDFILSTLYQHARAFVFPSLYEGFGMPILEAFYCQCPVLLSNSSCFPEIASDAALYFDPTSTQSIYDSLLKILGSDILRMELINRGNQRLQNFSWEKTAFSTLQIYKELYQR